MSQLLNFPHQLLIAIINSLAIGIVSYTLLRIILWAFKSASSTFKYHLSNVTLIIVFIAFLWPFQNLLYSPHAPANTIVNTPSVQPAPLNTSAIEKLPEVIQSSHFSLEETVNITLLKIEEWSHTILSFYLIGLLFFSVRLWVSFLVSVSLKKKGIVPADENWINSLAYAKEKLNIRRNVSIFFSGRVVSPCIIGISKAIVLIPLSLSTQLSTEQAEAILLHELAHLKHYDYYINIATQVLNCILFFNPFSWLICKKCRQYREQACDDIAIRENHNVALAETLALIAENTNEAYALTLMLKETKHKLFNRIQNLLVMKYTNRKYVNLVSALITTIIILSFSLVHIPKAYSQKHKESTIETLSKTMFDNGNDNYIFLDLLKDSLLSENEHYEFVYNKGVITFNGKPLPAPYGKVYLDRYKKFLKEHRNGDYNSFSSKRGDGISLEAFTDPKKSMFYAYTNVDSIRKENEKSDARVIQELVKDELIKPDANEKIELEFGKNGVKINNKEIGNSLRDKYEELLGKEYGFDPGRHEEQHKIFSAKKIKTAVGEQKVSTGYEQNPGGSLRNQLAAISKQMYNEGNEKYAIVDAISDSLVSFGPHYEMLFMSTSDVSVNAVHLSKQLKDKYVARMQQFAAGLGEDYAVILVKYNSSKPLSIKDILDPNSAFRKLNIVDRNRAGIRTAAKKKMIRYFLNDKLISPADEKLDITYGNADIIINNKTLTGALKAKYTKLLQTVYGVDLKYDSQSGVWNMPGSASEYIKGVSPSKTESGKTGFNNPLNKQLDYLNTQKKLLVDIRNRILDNRYQLIYITDIDNSILVSQVENYNDLVIKIQEQAKYLQTPSDTSMVKIAVELESCKHKILRAIGIISEIVDTDIASLTSYQDKGKPGPEEVASLMFKNKIAELRRRLMNGRYEMIPLEFQKPQLDNLITQYNSKVIKLESQEKVQELGPSNPYMVQTAVEIEATKRNMLVLLDQI